MHHTNIEIKARLRREDDAERIREVLYEHNARFVGRDVQVDTYFNAPSNGGRLKLREGTIENYLIYYHRPDQLGPKLSRVRLTALEDEKLRKVVKDALLKHLGARVVVEKEREIYFVGNVKVHLDDVKGLGRFVEIEAIDESGEIGEERLREQCEYFMERFRIDASDLIERSYSDMLLENSG
ncbi:CYTH domain-containing protein [Candidatus Pacearchaeota archaeon]|nr:MAG: CYTH domain-containing protein [Candidatus Pacearchaeota archaeon]